MTRTVRNRQYSWDLAGKKELHISEIKTKNGSSGIIRVVRYLKGREETYG